MSLANEDVTVTDADRDEAVRLLRDAAADKLIQSTEPRKQPEMVERIAAALADAREDCGHHSWAGLMALLDEHWPADIFPTREDAPARDAGPRIVSLIRHVADARAEADQLRDAMRALAEETLAPFHELFAGDPDTSCRTTWRREPGHSLPGNTTPLTECVEVPIEDLHDAFDRADAAAARVRDLADGGRR